jgi:hypothetical protein
MINIGGNMSALNHYEKPQIKPDLNPDMILSTNHEEVERLLHDAATVYSWDFDNAGRNLSDKRESFFIALTEASNMICRKGGSGYFWMVVSAKMLSFLEGIWQPMWESNYLPLGSSQVDFMGIINRRWKLYCDQYMNSEQVLIGLGDTNNLNIRFARMVVSNFDV